MKVLRSYVKAKILMLHGFLLLFLKIILGFPELLLSCTYFLIESDNMLNCEFLKHL